MAHLDSNVIPWLVSVPSPAPATEALAEAHADCVAEARADWVTAASTGLA